MRFKSREEIQLVARAATADGRSANGYMRAVLLRAARRALRR